jgi:hypothetical protein
MALFDSLLSVFQKSPNAVDGIGGEDRAEGIITELTKELTLEEKDDELLLSARSWKGSWEKYEKESLEQARKENESYWMGHHYDKLLYKSRSLGNRPVQENRIFADVETFLPIATRQNPEPLVSGGESEEGQNLAKSVSKMLAYQADRLKLRLKIKKSTRFWMLYMLGATKHAWNYEEDDIDCYTVRPQKLILDPNGYIDEDGYHGAYIGEYKERTAKDLATIFKKSKDEIEKLTNKKDGTKIGYIEWWTNDFVFWEISQKLVLGKSKHPHWNYDTENEKMNEAGQPVLENGQPVKEKITGKNHFKVRKMPYSFLTVFSLGNHPHDDANLIQQNLSIQDLINERLTQINKNVKKMNGGVIVSGKYFNQEEASQAAEAIESGKTIWQPSGNAGEAIQRFDAQTLPADVYNSVQDMRVMMDNVFGIHGTTRGEKQSNDTLGGQIIRKTSDTDRISFVSDYIEQYVDDIYNWWVQLMYVYYDNEHVGEVMGDEKAKEYIKLSKDTFEQANTRLLVSVREGSLIPKDPMIKRSEALDLWKLNAIDPITLFEKLDDPNPRERAKKLVKFQLDPLLLFPDLQAEIEKQKAEAAQLAQPAMPPETPIPQEIPVATPENMLQ